MSVAQGKLGDPITTGLYGIKGMPGYLIKVRVMINMTEPLHSQVYASNPVAEIFWVILVYEHLPLFSYHCGRLGHKAANCGYLDPKGEENFGLEMMIDESGHRLNEATLNSIHGTGITHSVLINPSTHGGKEAMGDGGRRRMESEDHEVVSGPRIRVIALPVTSSRGRKEKGSEKRKSWTVAEGRSVGVVGKEEGRKNNQEK
ncbi:unnamed protein product [Linum trigynum]